MATLNRILLVEDESLVLMLLEDMLADLGFTVCASAMELERALYLAEHESYDLALIDLNLNGSYTFPVADVVRGRGLPLIFSTGYWEGNINRSYADVPILNKPFNEASLKMALAPFKPSEQPASSSQTGRPEG